MAGCGYNWSNIDTRDFEKLAIDVVRLACVANDNIIIEQFKAGKDNGIDGRFYLIPGKPCIIQSKHYYNFNTLKGNLQKEFKKLKTREYFNNIDRYILVVSTPLSSSNKNEILKIFENIIKSSKVVITDFSRFGGENLIAQLCRNDVLFTYVVSY